MKMFTQLTIVLMIAALPLFGGGNSEDPAPMMEKAMDGGSMEKTMEGGAMEKTMGLTNFSDIDEAMMQAKTKPTVLFFAASWCPTCQGARADFEANLDKLEDINLLVVDYDHSAELQKKYGVTYQHTFVQISPEGEALVKWNGGATDDLLMKIKREEM